jgi:hypothetical protein
LLLETKSNVPVINRLTCVSYGQIRINNRIGTVVIPGGQISQETELGCCRGFRLGLEGLAGRLEKKERINLITISGSVLKPDTEPDPHSIADWIRIQEV